MSKLANGTYLAKARGPFTLGEIKNEKRTPFIEFEFVVTKGPSLGSNVRYTGFLSDAAALRTIKSLRNCGWRGNDVSEFSDGEAHGCLDEVEIVIEQQTAKNGNSYASVTWVNQLNSKPVRVVEKLSADAASSLGDRLRAIAESNPAESAVTNGSSGHEMLDTSVIPF